MSHYDDCYEKDEDARREELDIKEQEERKMLIVHIDLDLFNLNLEQLKFLRSVIDNIEWLSKAAKLFDNIPRS